MSGSKQLTEVHDDKKIPAVQQPENQVNDDRLAIIIESTTDSSVLGHADLLSDTRFQGRQRQMVAR